MDPEPTERAAARGRSARRATRFVRAVLAGTLACSGCRSPAPGAGDAGSAAPAASAEDPVLARVGDHAITLREYQAALDHMDQFDRLRFSAADRRQDLLEEMIDVELLAQEARDRGYDQDPETQEELRQILRDAVLQTVRAKAPAPNDIADADVRAYYEAHRSDFRDPERRRVSAIVLDSARAAASALSAALAATDPATWGQIVRSRSVDPSAKADVPPDLAGDFGFVNAPGVAGDRGANPRVPDEVRAAVFEVEHVGDVVPRVVAARGKFFVVKLVAKSDAHDRSLEDAARSIRVKLAQDKLRSLEADFVDQLRREFPVVIDRNALSQVRVGDAGP